MDLEGGRQGEVATKGQKEGAAKEEVGRGGAGFCLLFSIPFWSKTCHQEPRKSCAQLLDAVRTWDSSSSPAATFPNLLDASAPFGPQPFRGKKGVLRGTQKEVSQWRVAP